MILPTAITTPLASGSQKQQRAGKYYTTRDGNGVAGEPGAWRVIRSGGQRRRAVGSQINDRGALIPPSFRNLRKLMPALRISREQGGDVVELTPLPTLPLTPHHVLITEATLATKTPGAPALPLPSSPPSPAQEIPTTTFCCPFPPAS